MALTDEDKAWMLQKLEQVETRLLTEFHKWASPTDSRLRSFREVLHTLDLEFDAPKDRVRVLEDRKSS